MSRLVIGQKVVAVNGDERIPATVTQVFDEDQGDFEYYVTYDAPQPIEGRESLGSFWNREGLEAE